MFRSKQIQQKKKKNHLSTFKEKSEMTAQLINMKQLQIQR